MEWPLKPWILVIDDDDGFRECAKDIFKMEGYQVKTAENGAEALDILGAEKEGPGLILLDLWMPGMSGADFLERLEVQLPELSEHTPVLLCSASAPDFLGKFRGRHPFLAKPADIDRIVSMARSMIQ